MEDNGWLPRTEIEGFYNLVFSHLFTLWPLNSPQIKESLASLLRTISSEPTKRPSTKFRMSAWQSLQPIRLLNLTYSLSNLFNVIPRTSPLRLTVYSTILNFASSNDQLDTLQLQPATVEKWLKEWDISPEDKSTFLKSLIDTFTSADQVFVLILFFYTWSLLTSKWSRPTAYQYSLPYVRSLPSNSPTVQTAAIETISTALRLPNLFDFYPLYKLDAVIAMKDHELFALLQVFLSGGIPELKHWQINHPDSAKKYSASQAQNVSFAYLKQCNCS